MPFRAFAASALAVAILAGCGGDDGSSQDAQPTVTRTAAPAETATATAPDAAPAILKAYFLQEGKVAVASRSVVAGPAVARAALVQLLEGPTAAERARGLRSAIPAGTELEDVAIDDDGTAAVELSQSLDVAATAQVVYTVTQFPGVRRVRLEGAEYVRADFEEQTPAILVESPVPGEEVSSPLRIEGTANTFEATFQVEVVDARGRVVGERFVTATSGSGERGTFDAAVTFAAMPGPVRLVTYEVSAEDGSRTNETAIPLQAAP